MTREQADKLQAALDEYVELSKKDAPKDNMRNLLLMEQKRKLVAIIEPLITKAPLPGNDMDAVVIGTLMARVLFPSVVSGGLSIPMSLAVVDGHEAADKTKPDEYNKKYKIRVPGEIVGAALSRRTSGFMMDLATKAASEKQKEEKEEV